jgi:TctA family transporter
MLTSVFKFSIFQGIKKYRIWRVIFIALFWTLIDSIITILNYNDTQSNTKSIIKRELLVFLMSGIMGYLFVYTLGNIFKDAQFCLTFLPKRLP